MIIAYYLLGQFTTPLTFFLAFMFVAFLLYRGVTAVPDDGGRIPSSTLMSVLFPAPFAPTNPMLPGGMLPLSPSNATKSP